MPLFAHSKLDQGIVKHLARSDSLSAEQLNALLRTNHLKYSIQAIYYALRKLQRFGVVVKVQDRFSINLSWAFEIVQFADELFDKQIVSAPAAQLLPASGKKHSWTFTNLLKLDDLWVQLMLLLFQRTKTEVLFGWCPHPWFYFAQAKKLSSFHAALLRENREIRTLLGGDTFLDRAFRNEVLFGVHHFAVAKSAFEKRWRTHYSTMGEYIISVNIPASTMHQITALFEQVTSVEKLNYPQISAVLNAKTRARLEIAHAPEKARRLQRKLARYFK